jgi:hypothetical protein
MINSFWWGLKPSENQGIHCMTWHKLSVAKDYGGMGFRNLYAFNIAMLAKQA